MSQPANISEIINRLTGGNSGNPEIIWFYKGDRYSNGTILPNMSAGRPNSLWMMDGQPNGGGAIPGAVANPDNTTIGSLQQTDPSGGRKKWILGWGANTIVGHAGFYVHDRLLHIGGLSGTNTGAQTVGGTLSRNTGGDGNEIWVEIYTVIGVTTTTITASYTNQAGTAGRTTVAVSFGGTNMREVGRTIKLPLQEGDTGVQSVQSVTLLASTGTAGNFGVNILKPMLTTFSFVDGFEADYSRISSLDGLVEVPAGACLQVMIHPSGAVSTRVFGFISMIEE